MSNQIYFWSFKFY